MLSEPLKFLGTTLLEFCGRYTVFPLTWWTMVIFDFVEFQRDDEDDESMMKSLIKMTLLSVFVKFIPYHFFPNSCQISACDKASILCDSSLKIEQDKLFYRRNYYNF